jgi:hypothetical protein
MNVQDKELIEEKFSGLTTLMNAQFSAMSTTLDGINHRLDKLNGKVAEHEKIINRHLPHTMNDCTQVNTIKEIRDNMVSSQNVQKYLSRAIGGAAAVFSIIFIVYKMFVEPIL